MCIHIYNYTCISISNVYIYNIYTHLGVYTTQDEVCFLDFCFDDGLSQMNSNNTHVGKLKARGLCLLVCPARTFIIRANKWEAYEQPHLHGEKTKRPFLFQLPTPHMPNATKNTRGSVSGFPTHSFMTKAKQMGYVTKTR